MFRNLRRFLVFQVFLLWQGGFVFYAAVVVPIGTDVLGSARIQGLITQQVTDGLNLCGAMWAVVVFADWWATRDPNRRRTQIRGTTWFLIVLLLAVLTGLHPLLDGHIDDETGAVHERDRFRFLHGVYLSVSTAQWALAVVLAWFTLRAWAEEDRLTVPATAPPPTA